jgi:hypothetical protein
MVMGGLSGIETALIFLVGLSGLVIGLVVLFSRLDWWIEYFADLMVNEASGGVRRR